MISQLCTSTLNVKRFLEKGLLEELVNLMLLGGDDNIKKEAVFCLSKVSTRLSLISILGLGFATVAPFLTPWYFPSCFRSLNA